MRKEQLSAEHPRKGKPSSVRKDDYFNVIMPPMYFEKTCFVFSSIARL